MSLRTWIITCCFLLVITEVLLAQPKRLESGIVFKAGTSQIGSDALSTSFYEGSAMQAAATGFYSFLRHKVGDQRIFLDFVKVDLHPFAFRGGYYDVAGNPVKITGLYIDLDALLFTLRYNLVGRVDGFIAFGPSVSFALTENKSWMSTAGTLDTQAVQPGVVIDLGVCTPGASNFGLRVMNTFTEYPYSEVSVYFGIGFGTMRNASQANE